MQFVGQPPMQISRSLAHAGSPPVCCASSNATVAAIALDVGYDSGGGICPRLQADGWRAPCDVAGRAVIDKPKRDVTVDLVQ